MPKPSVAPPARGLDRLEKLLFLFGVLAFAFLVVVFGQGSGVAPLPIAGVLIVLGVGFVWWFDRHLARRRD